MDSHPHPPPASGRSDPESDRILVEKASARDPAALDEFIRRLRCVPRILGAINSHYGKRLDEHDLADLAQDTVILMWRKLSTFNGQGTIETWAYGVGRFEYLNASRRKGFQEREREGLEGGLQVAAPEAHAPLEEEDLLTILHRIPPDEAEVIRLKHVLDLTFEEIGKRLAISPNTGKTRYYRGLQGLERELRASDERRRGG